MRRRSYIMAPMDPTLQVFISSVDADRAHANEICTRLASAGFLPWAAHRDIPAGADWREEIQRAISRVGAFVALLSKAAATSRWVKMEIGAALARTGLRVIPVALEPCTGPPELSPRQRIDLFAPGGWDLLFRALGDAASTALTALVPPQDLVAACQKGDCVAFVGAGVSGAMKFPTWQPLVEHLLGWARREALISPDSLASLDAALKAQQLDLVADNVVNAAQTERRYPDLLSAVRPIYDRRDVAPGPVHQTLGALGLSAVLTTNFDPLLEATFAGRFDRVLTPLDPEPLLDALTKRQFFLLKLYGTLDRQETILIAPTQ